MGPALRTSAPDLAPAGIARWPQQVGWRRERAALGAPTLLVIDRGAPIPPLGPGEDFVWSDADERDVAHRLLDLAGRAGAASEVADVELPDDLPAPARRTAARLLAAVGVLVPRADLAVDDLAETTETLRRVLGPQGWSLIDVGDAGLLLVREGRGEP